MSVGGWAVLIGAAVVILIALLLLMFNIQRTLLRMKEMMEQVSREMFGEEITLGLKRENTSKDTHKYSISS